MIASCGGVTHFKFCVDKDVRSYVDHPFTITNRTDARTRFDLYRVDELRPLWRQLELKVHELFHETQKHFIHDTLPGNVAIMSAVSGCCAQKWHKDNKQKAWNICIPLTHMDTYNGATEILLFSESITLKKRIGHMKHKLIMQSAQNDAFIFDQRLIHRGGSNQTSEDRLLLICNMTCKPIEYAFEGETY